MSVTEWRDSVWLVEWRPVKDAPIHRRVFSHERAADDFFYALKAGADRIGLHWDTHGFLCVCTEVTVEHHA